VANKKKSFEGEGEDEPSKWLLGIVGGCRVLTVFGRGKGGMIEMSQGKPYQCSWWYKRSKHWKGGKGGRIWFLLNL